ncbi:MAG: TonB-dependent receptor [Bacteroidota bacterium]
MRRNILFFTASLLGLLFSFCEPAQAFQSGYRLSGTVVDAVSGEPLAGALIRLPDINRQMIANEKGQFVLTQVPAGHHVMEISALGFSIRVEHFELNADLVWDFRLNPNVTEHAGVIITGVGTATIIRKTPVAISTLRRQALLQSAYTNIVDAMTTLPGVSAVNTGPAIAKPIIRGLGANRIVVMQDGVRQEGQQWGDEHGIEVDEASVNGIEVVKGPASLMYGSDAMAGVVQFLTQAMPSEGMIQGHWLNGFQSNSGLLHSNLRIAGQQKGFNWGGYVTYKSAHDYSNRLDGRVLNARFSERNLGGQIGINRLCGFSHLIFSRFHQEPGLIEGDRDASAGKFLLYAGSPLERIATHADLRGRNPWIPNQQVIHDRLVSDNQWSVGSSQLKVNLAWQRNQRIEFGNPEDPNEKELYFDLNTLNYTVHWKLPTTQEWHTTIGTNGMRQENKNRGEELLIPAYRLFDVGIFAHTQRYFKNGTLSGGLRYDYRHLVSEEAFEGTEQKFIAQKNNFTNVSASVGYSWELDSALTLKANVARGFRAPTIAELASNGTHEGTNRYEYGTSSLHSERSWQYDVGFELSYDHLQIGLSAFHNSINDFIFYQKLQGVNGQDSLVEVDGEWIQAYQFEQGNARLNGLEVVFDLHPHPLDWLHWQNSFSWVQGRFSQRIDPGVPGSDRLPLIPAPRWRSEFRADAKKWRTNLRRLYSKLEIDINATQRQFFSGFETETATNGYTLVNWGMGSDVVNKKNQLMFSWHAGITNLFDVAWQSHLSRLKYTDENLTNGRSGVFNQGRNFHLKLIVPIRISQ